MYLGTRTSRSAAELFLQRESLRAGLLVLLTSPLRADLISMASGCTAGTLGSSPPERSLRLSDQIEPLTWMCLSFGSCWAMPWAWSQGSSVALWDGHQLRLQSCHMPTISASHIVLRASVRGKAGRTGSCRACRASASCRRKGCGQEGT